jgi:hypothetical protein
LIDWISHCIFLLFQNLARELVQFPNINAHVVLLHFVLSSDRMQMSVLPCKYPSGALDGSSAYIFEVPSVFRLPAGVIHATSGAIREDWGTYHDELYPEADTGSSQNVNDGGMK